MSEPQQIINVGEVANDGTGESLRDAFNAVNNNFANVWAAGPVDSQVVISNNRVSTNETNLDLILAGNGVGNVTVASTTVPSIDAVYDLGRANRRFDEVHAVYYYGNGAYLTGITGNGGGGPNVYFSQGAPGNASIGDIWIESDTGVQYLYFNDDTSNQWAEMEAYQSFSTTNVSANTGNWGFSGNNLYNINGGNIINGDLTHGYTAGITIPTNGDANAILLNNTYGNIILQSGANSDPTATWTFGGDGNTTLPTGGRISNYPGGTGANNDSWFVTPGNGTGGVSSQDGQQYIQINNNLFVEIGTSYGTANASVWQFSRDGDFGAPGNISTTGNVSGAYILGNGSQLTGLPASYSNSNATTLLANFGSNTISTTGNITSGNLLTGGLISATANITGGNITTAGVLKISGSSAYIDVAGTGYIQNAGMGEMQISTVAGRPLIINTNAGAYGWNFGIGGNLTLPNGGTISGTGNITAGYFFGNGSQLTGLPATYSNSNVTTLLAAFGSNAISTTGNITANNISGNLSVLANSAGRFTLLSDNTLLSGTVANPQNFKTSDAYTPDIDLRNSSGTGTFTQGATSYTIRVAGTNNLILDNTGLLSAPGNISTPGQISAAGNITGNYFFGNGSALTSVATQVTGSWNVPVGNSTQSFTVNSGTYSMWVDCNIPNGILVWNATATVTNTNVPVVGYQYAWVYNGGGTPIDFTSIPNQFVGTANAILRSNTAPSSTTNRFDFGINNTSGGNVTVRYSYTKL